MSIIELVLQVETFLQNLTKLICINWSEYNMPTKRIEGNQKLAALSVFLHKFYSSHYLENFLKSKYEVPVVRWENNESCNLQ